MQTVPSARGNDSPLKQAFDMYCQKHVPREGMVFVTAISADHVEEARDMIRGVASCFPGRRIVVYDLGLLTAQASELDDMCNVSVLPFDWSRYPYHVRFISEYRFKPIAVHETLFDLRGVVGSLPAQVFWIDSSVRFLCPAASPWLRVVSTLEHMSMRSFPQAWAVAQNKVRRDGIVFFAGGGLRQWQTTPDSMFKYLPTSESNKLKAQWGAGAILFGERSLAPIVAWWVACALDPLCMLDKTDASEPWFTGDANVSRGGKAHVVCPLWQRFRGGRIACSRTDQSAINILAANALGDVRKEIGLLHIWRHVSDFYGPEVCSPASQLK